MTTADETEVFETARAMYDNEDTIQIWDTARVEHCPDAGWWVQAWVWVTPEDVESYRKENKDGVWDGPEGQLAQASKKEK